MKQRVVVLALGLVLALPAPAFADHDGYREGCGRNGGCGNEREEEYGDGSCKYFCPAFDRSPVEDSFNPTICVMPGSCTDQGEKKKQKKQ